MANKLNQVVAIEKGIKSRVYEKTSDLYKKVQKPDLFAGFSKTYRPKDEEGETFPPESKKVQLKVDEVLAEVGTALTELFDITATKDLANCKAKADVRLNGSVLAKDVPATYLLFLEKQLTDIHSILKQLPTLDEQEDWTEDTNANLYKTVPTETYRSKKVQKALVLFPATVEHPAQTQLVSEDVVAGYWTAVKQSGAIPPTRKRVLLERAETLLKAVKQAREEANLAEAEEVKVGKAIFDYLLN